MAQRSRFADGVSYPSTVWADFIKGVRTDGYVPGTNAVLGDELKVHETSPPSMSLRVNLGIGWVDGRYFEVYSAEQAVGPLANASPTNPRIDRIVVRHTVGATPEPAALAILQGTPAASPAAPALTRNTTFWDISLARVLIGAGVGSIVDANITDERDDASVCGKSVDRSLPYHNHDGSYDDGAQIGGPTQLLEVFENPELNLDDEMMFYVHRAPTACDLVIRGRVSRSGLVGSHAHNLYATSDDDGSNNSVEIVGGPRNSEPGFVRPTGSGGYTTAQRPTGVQVRIDGVDRTSALGGPFGVGSSGADWNTGSLSILSWVSTIGWHTVAVRTTTTPGKLKCHILMTA